MWATGGNDYEGYGAANETGNGFINSPSAGAGKNAQRHNNIVPCTCAEILACEAKDDAFVNSIGMTISQVVIVGIVRSVNITATRVDYEIDDYTGPPVQVKQFIEADEISTTGDKKVFDEGSYMRVIGNIRVLQNITTVSAFKTKPVHDLNELVSHMLEVFHSHLQHKHSHLEVQKPGATKSIEMFAGMSDSPAGGFTPIQSEICSVVSSCKRLEGLTVKEICSALRGIPEPKIRAEIEFLSAEGHIYTTMDEDHYRATEG